jgi:hypothetical protein
MPRPTTAQLAYGSLTVVLSTFAALLLTGVRSGAAVAAVAVGGLLLGLLVALALGTKPAARTPLPPAAVPVPRPRVARAPGGAARVREHSLRR